MVRMIFKTLGGCLKDFKPSWTRRYKSMYDLIYTEVIPQWTEYLRTKRERTSLILGNKRADTFKKKILRDLREFYRILFRKRFASKVYKTKHEMVESTNNFFKDFACFQLRDAEIQDYQLFRYLHQTHASTVTKVVGEKWTENSHYWVLTNYNDRKFVRFLKQPLTAQLFYFVYGNFMDIYAPEIKSEYRSKVTKMVKSILEFYRNWPDTRELQLFTSEVFLS